jgi:hypothetical protein
MKVYRNTNEIQRRDKIGRRLSMTGLVILFLGLMASFIPTWLYPPGTTPTSAWGTFLANNWAIISFGALPLGFLAASLGTYFITRYARRRWPNSNIIARPDEYFERNLKGLDDRYSLFIYSLPVGYALLTPFALLTFAMRSDKGRISVDGDRWREAWSMGRLLTLFAREGVGNPSDELRDHAAKLQAHLANAAATAGVNLADTPIDGSVVFLNADARLTLNNPTVPVLRVDQVKEWVRKRSRDLKPLPAAHYKALADYLQKANTATVTTVEPAVEEGKKPAISSRK